MPKFDRDESIRICRLLWGVVENIKTDINKLRVSHPSWTETDIRISSFAKLQNAIIATTLGLKFYTDYLIDQDWWNTNSANYSPDDKKRINLAYENFQKIGIIQVGFLAIESSIRSILRAIDKTACKNATAEFKSIYEHLIRTQLSLSNDWCDLLDLWREVRNTIHNNGVYFPKNGYDKTISYKGKTYQFLNGKKIDFITWDMFVELLEEARMFLGDIIDHPKVSGISGTLTDPYA